MVDKKLSPKLLIQSILAPVLDELNAGIALVDSKGTIQWVNTILEDWFNSADELISYPYEKIYRDNLENIHLDLKNFSEQKICFSKTLQDGLPRQFQLTSYPIQKKLSKKYKFILLVRDITGTKGPEKPVHKEDTINRAANNSSIVGIAITDLEGKIIYTNQHGAQIFGYTSADEVIGLEGLKLFTEDDQISIIDYIQQLTDGAQLEEKITKMRKRDGTPILVKISATALRDNHGRPYQMLITLQDISEKMNLERTQDAIYQIAHAAGSPARLDEIYPTLHEIIKGIMPANNFYIALYNPKNDAISFPYFVDEHDPPPPPVLLSDQKSITAYVLRSARSLLCTQEVSKEYTRKGAFELVGSEPVIWLGSPLIIEGETIGVIAVQHYDDPYAYTLKEQRVLEFVSTEIAKAILSKRTEEALQESEKRFRNIVESSPFGVHLYRLMPDKSLVFIAANESANQILGVDCTKFIGKNLEDSFPTLAETEIPSAFSKVAAEGGYWQHRRISPATAGILRGVDIFAFQSSPNEVAVFIQDITAKLQTDQALIESEKRFRSVVESSPMGIIIYQLTEEDDLIFIDSNQAADEILGVDSQQFIGKKIEDVFQDLAETDIPATYRKIAAKGGVYHGSRIRQKDNKVSSAFEIFVFQISPMQVAVLYQDITNRLQTEEEIKRLNEELEERVAQRTAELEAANREMEAFAYSVSHDLRAPVRSIKGFSEILLVDIQSASSEEIHQYLERIYNSSIKMDRLIDDLLSLSYLENQDLDIQTLDLSQLVLNIVVQLDKDYPSHKFHVKIEDTPTTRADQSMVQIMLTNLITNAYKFTADNPQPQIVFGCQKNPSGTTYYLKDNGIGFDMEYADKIFTPFARLHSTEYEGTGIGLAIVRRVIQRHQGRIWAVSEIGRGATFYFSFGTEKAIT